MLAWTKFLNLAGKILKKENLIGILIAMVAILFVICLQTCKSKRELKSDLETEKNINRQNIAALTDSIRIVSDKVGNTEFNKNAFVTKLDGLENLNDSLYNLILNVRGDVISIINSKVHGDIPPMEVDNKLLKYDDGVTFGLQFALEYKDAGLVSNIAGVSDFKAYDNKVFAGKTMITGNTISLGLTYGFKEYDDKYEIFAKSASPFVTIDELDGALIIPKKKNSLITPTTKKKAWGIGPNASVMYGFGGGKLDMGVGIGIQYNFIRF